MVKLKTEWGKYSHNSKLFYQGFTSVYKRMPAATPKILSSDFVEQISRKKWTQIIKTSNRKIVLTQARLKILKTEQRKINNLSQQRNQLLVGFKAVFIPVSKRNDWHESKAILIKRLQNAGKTKIQIKDYINEIEKSSYVNIQASFEKLSINTENLLNILFSKHLAMYMGYRYAGLAAKFNALIADHTRSTKDITKYLKEVNDLILSMHKEIHLSLANNNLEAAKVSAVKLADYCNAELGGDAIKLAARICKMRQGNAAEFHSKGDFAIAIANTLRYLLFSLSMSKYVEWVCGYEMDFKIVNKWIEAAKKLKFKKLPLPFKVVGISKLISESKKFNGIQIAVQGQVQSVKIVHKNLKVISSAILTDSGGNIMTIVLPHIKIDSGGIVPGGYLRICGTWRTSSKENTGFPALEVDRIDLTTESKTNWSAWVMLHLRYNFEQVPHSINANFSWEPGENGAINPIRYGTFCSNK